MVAFIAVVAAYLVLAPFSQAELLVLPFLGNPEGKRHKKGAEVLRPQPQINNGPLSLTSISHRCRRHRRRCRHYRGFALLDSGYGLAPD